MSNGKDDSAGVLEKTVIFLVGPKGAGKSYIGRFLGQQPQTTFINVEPMFLSSEEPDMNDGYAKVERAIDKELMMNVSRTTETITTMDESHVVVLETLGGGPPGYQALIASLRKKYNVKYIRIKTELETCMERFPLATRLVIFH